MPSIPEPFNDSLVSIRLSALGSSWGQLQVQFLVCLVTCCSVSSLQTPEAFPHLLFTLPLPWEFIVFQTYLTAIYLVSNKENIDMCAYSTVFTGSGNPCLPRVSHNCVSQAVSKCGQGGASVNVPGIPEPLVDLCLGPTHLAHRPGPGSVARVSRSQAPVPTP